MPWCVIWQRKSAWVTVDCLMDILRALKKAIRAMEPYAHFVLIMDCLSVHVTPRILRHVALLDIAVAFVPASMTGFLQPLDAFVFASLKREFEALVEDARVTSRDGSLSNQTVVMCAISATAKVLAGRSWTHAFRGCGFGLGQRGVCGRIRRALEWPDGMPHIGHTLPSLDELACVWPRRSTVPLTWLFHVPRKYEQEEPGVGHHVVDVAREEARVSLCASDGVSAAPSATSSAASSFSQPHTASASSEPCPHAAALPRLPLPESRPPLAGSAWGPSLPPMGVPVGRPLHMRRSQSMEEVSQPASRS